LFSGLQNDGISGNYNYNASNSCYEKENSDNICVKKSESDGNWGIYSYNEEESSDNDKILYSSDYSGDYPPFKFKKVKDENVTVYLSWILTDINSIQVGDVNINVVNSSLSSSSSSLLNNRFENRCLKIPINSNSNYVLSFDNLNESSSSSISLENKYFNLCFYEPSSSSSVEFISQ
jgi:hypothetical protein